jgi:mono/diheme cytochrome c family protein
MKTAQLLAVALIVALPFAVQAEYKTIDDLAKAYSVDKCKTCHAKVHDEWKSSYHSQSIVHSLGGIRNFIVVGLGQEWKKPVNRDNLMRCMDCHAPMLREASEPLARQVADMIVAAVDEKDEGKKAAAKKELARLNVNCIICHNSKISIAKNLVGAPKPGVYYGPTGKASPAHGTEKTPVISTALFCGQCHGIYTPPDGDFIGCNTLYGSYQDGFRGNGGTETCQDCHMKAGNKGHRFPGAYDVEMVKEGIAVDVQAAGVKLTPGKWAPTAVVNVGLINNAGHRIPDG